MSISHVTVASGGIILQLEGQGQVTKARLLEIAGLVLGYLDNPTTTAPLHDVLDAIQVRGAFEPNPENGPPAKEDEHWTGYDYARQGWVYLQIGEVP